MSQSLFINYILKAFGLINKESLLDIGLVILITATILDKVRN